MKIIILGDKYQKGSKSQGCCGLIKFNSSSTILENQYKILKNKFPSAKIIYIYGFDNKKLLVFLQNKKFEDIDFVYNSEYDTYNECFSLKIIKNQLDTDTLILSGYNVFSANSFNHIKLDGSKVFIDQSSASKIGCTINDNIVENIFYDLDTKIHPIYFLDKSTSIICKKILESNKINNAFLFEAINQCISYGCKFNTNLLFSKNIKYNKKIMVKVKKNEK